MRAFRKEADQLIADQREAELILDLFNKIQRAVPRYVETVRGHLLGTTSLAGVDIAGCRRS